MYVLKEWLLPSNDDRTWGSQTPKTVVIHNTAMDADAESEAKYVHSKKGEVTYHYAVDDKVAIKLLPHNRSGWHCGDGGTTIGSKGGIAIEICFSKSGGSRYKKAEDNGARLAAKILYDENLGINALSKHQDWALDKKYCPHRILKYTGWDNFVALVSKYYDELKGKSRLSTNEFIEKIAPVVVKNSTNILPSVSIAQAILESDSGNSELAVRANNLFGIKAKDWNGLVFGKVTSEYINGKYVNTVANFRSYESWENSIIDHDLFFVTPSWRKKHYEKVLKSKTAEEQAKALSICGYATDPKYSAKLIEIINKYDLKKYDNLRSDNKLSLKNKVVIGYVNDGDLANALALHNALYGSVLVKSNDLTGIANTIIQVGGASIKGATVVLKGKDRADTLNKVNEYIQNSRSGK